MVGAGAIGAQGDTDGNCFEADDKHVCAATTIYIGHIGVSVPWF